MSKSLGSLGNRNADVDLDFEWFGATIRVHPKASDLSVADLMLNFGDVDVDSLEGQQVAMQAMSEFMVGQIHAEDRQLFWSLAKENNQMIRDIMEVAKAISEGVADFRSGQRSDSSATPLPTNGNSGPASSSVDDSARREAVVAAALAELPNRPDMRLFLYRQEAARRQEEAEAAQEAAAKRTPLGLTG